MRHSYARSKAAFTLLVLFGLFVIAAGAMDGARAVVKRTNPIYPELAHQMHLGGGVMLVVTIDSSGTVTDVKVQSGHPLLTKAAEDAVRQWKYAPAASATEATVYITFEAR